MHKDIKEIEQETYLNLWGQRSIKERNNVTTLTEIGPTVNSTKEQPY